MAAPGTIHQRIVSWMTANIRDYIRKNKSDCKVFFGPLAVFIKNDDRNCVEPDVFICDKDKLDDRGCNGAPDFIAEVITSVSARHDYITKLALYEASGVQEYWIVNPVSQSIMVYYFAGEIQVKQYCFADKVKVNLYDELYIDFAEVDLVV